MSKFKYEYASKTVIGTREEQQDSMGIFNENETLAAIVCDGMGGLNGGSKASKASVETLVDLIKNRDRTEDVSNFFLRCVDILDEKVFSFIDEEGNKLNAGTTIVSALIEKDSLYWMSVGDSRLYILRGQDFVRATRDHNYFLSLKAMPETFVPTENDISKGNSLISFIGMGGVDVMDISTNPVELFADDVILLTTDGLFKAVSDDQIKEILTVSESMIEAVEKLLFKAEELSPESRDNITYIAIKVKENKDETDKM